MSFGHLSRFVSDFVQDQSGARGCVYRAQNLNRETIVLLLYSLGCWHFSMGGIFFWELLCFRFGHFLILGFCFPGSLHFCCSASLRFAFLLFCFSLLLSFSAFLPLHFSASPLFCVLLLIFLCLIAYLRLCFFASLLLFCFSSLKQAKGYTI